MTDPIRPTGLNGNGAPATGEEGNESNMEVEGNQEDDGGESTIEEGIEAKGIKKEDRPDKETVDKHNLTHIPYRAWCPHCVRGRGVSNAYKTRAGRTGNQAKIPVVQ